MTLNEEDDLKKAKPETMEEVLSRTKSKTKEKAKVGPRPAAARKRKPKFVVLQSLWPGRHIVLADTVPSGTRYEFPAAGSVLPVSAEDVPELLSRRRKPAGCCGSGRVEQPYFQLA